MKIWAALFIFSIVATLVLGNEEASNSQQGEGGSVAEQNVEAVQEDNKEIGVTRSEAAENGTAKPLETPNESASLVLKS